MPTKPKTASRILDAVHETARDLQSVGFVSERRMQEYDALCLELPLDTIIPAWLVVSRDSGQAVLARIIKPRRPTKAMRKLFGK